MKTQATKRRAPVILDNLHAGQLLSDLEAAAALDTAPATLAHWRSTGRYNLPFIKVGRKVRYKAGDLRAFLARRTQYAYAADEVSA